MTPPPNRHTLPMLALAAVSLLVAEQPAAAQAERYELGRRMRAFETAWEAAKPAGRAAALKELPKVTGQFFRLQFGGAGRTLDAARHALAGHPADPETAWAEALSVAPAARLIDAGAKHLTATVKPFYPVGDADPTKLTARLTLGGGGVDAPLGKLPVTVAVPLPPVAGWGDDLSLTLEVRRGEEVLATQAVTVSVVPDLKARLAALPKPENPATIEAATLGEHAARLSDLADGGVAESDAPAAKLLAEAEALTALKPGARYFTAGRPGDFRLTLPLPPTSAKGTFGRAAVRLLVPPQLNPTTPVPLVVALHGAGGSENLFFEGYGAGHVVKECERRGWLLVAPRAGLFGAPPVADIVTALSGRYPVDPRAVFLVGHSMGAGQAAELAQQSPAKDRAVALLGGAARVRDAKAFAALPLFVGVGTQDDLALSSSRSLNKIFMKAGAKKLTYREYDGADHLVIVRTALPDVFTQWDALLAR
jgi:predicted esterase